MKRNHPQKDIITYSTTSGAATSSVTDGGDVTGKGKNKWGEGDDELLVVLGYKVKSSDMDVVAQKIEHLEGVLGNDDGLSQIASDSVHYNPSDLNSWLESMICELNPAVEPPTSGVFRGREYHQSTAASTTIEGRMFNKENPKQTLSLQQRSPPSGSFGRRAGVIKVLHDEMNKVPGSNSLINNLLASDLVQNHREEEESERNRDER